LSDNALHTLSRVQKQLHRDFRSTGNIWTPNRGSGLKR
jgi:hypothetical protein